MAGWNALNEMRRIKMPMSEADARSLKAGETVLLDGEIVVSAGLPAYQRIADYVVQGRSLPLNLNEGSLFHLGSFIRDTSDGPEVLYMNPTTSTRFNALMPGIIRAFRLHAVGGKGGLDAAGAQAMRESGCVYLSFLGGGCPLLSQALRGVIEVQWSDLLTHYRLVRLKVEGLGPATVGIDAQGGNLYEVIALQAAERMNGIRAELARRRSSGRDAAKHE